jgi:hypothetical protein
MAADQRNRKHQYTYNQPIPVRPATMQVSDTDRNQTGTGQRAPRHALPLGQTPAMALTIEDPVTEQLAATPTSVTASSSPSASPPAT